MHGLGFDFVAGWGSFSHILVTSEKKKRNKVNTEMFRAKSSTNQTTPDNQDLNSQSTAHLANPVTLGENEATQGLLVFVECCFDFFF